MCKILSHETNVQICLVSTRGLLDTAAVRIWICYGDQWSGGLHQRWKWLPHSSSHHQVYKCTLKLVPGRSSNWSVTQIPEAAPRSSKPLSIVEGKKNERITQLAAEVHMYYKSKNSTCWHAHRIAAKVHAYYKNKNTTYWQTHRSRYWGGFRILSPVTPTHAIWARECIYRVIWSFNLNSFWITMCSYTMHLPLEALPPDIGIII